MNTSRRVALVTGGASGIGRGIATGLVEDGFDVVIADLNRDGAQAAADEIGARAIGLDVTDTAEVNAAIGDLGAVDVLVNCAGWDDLMPFVKTDEAFWDRVVEINYKGVLRTTHAVLPGMIERGYGRIVNIASDAGRVGSSLEAVYAGAKGGVIAFGKTVAREVARKGVTVNAVCPGPTDTPMLQRIVAESPGEGDKVIAGMTAAVPMKRLATPADIAVAVRMFAREDAGYITGQTLSVSGGLTMA